MLPEPRRYAEWLPGMRSSRPSILTTLGLVVGNAAVALPLIALLTLGRTSTHVLLAAMIVGLVFGAVFQGLGLTIDVRRRIQGRPVRDLPAPVAQFPVVVFYRREDVYGTDTGNVAFVEGWLVFSGRNADFAVRSGDIERHFDDGRLTFSFSGPGGAHRVAFRPSGRGMREAWIDWIRAKADVPGAPIYPPVVPSPNHQPPPVILVQPVVFGIGGVVLWPYLPWVAALMLTFGALFFAAQWWGRDALRRLAKGQPPRAERLRRAWFGRGF